MPIGEGDRARANDAEGVWWPRAELARRLGREVARPRVWSAALSGATPGGLDERDTRDSLAGTGARIFPPGTRRRWCHRRPLRTRSK